MVIFCPGCDSENNDLVKKCSKCGRKLDGIILTERERIINTLNVSMLNWQIKMIPDNKKEEFLKAILATKHITVSDQMLIDIINALNNDNAKAVQENIGILGIWGKMLRPIS